MDGIQLLKEKIVKTDEIISLYRSKCSENDSLKAKLIDRSFTNHNNENCFNCGKQKSTDSELQNIIKELSTSNEQLKKKLRIQTNSLIQLQASFTPKHPSISIEEKLKKQIEQFQKDLDNQKEENKKLLEKIKVLEIELSSSNSSPKNSQSKTLRRSSRTKKTQKNDKFLSVPANNTRATNECDSKSKRHSNHIEKQSMDYHDDSEMMTIYDEMSTIINMAKISPLRPSIDDCKELCSEYVYKQKLTSLMSHENIKLAFSVKDNCVDLKIDIEDFPRSLFQKIQQQLSTNSKLMEYFKKIIEFNDKSHLETVLNELNRSFNTLNDELTFNNFVFKWIQQNLVHLELFFDGHIELLPNSFDCFISIILWLNYLSLNSNTHHIQSLDCVFDDLQKLLDVDLHNNLFSDFRILLNKISVKY